MTLIITKSKRKKVTHWLDSHLGISLFLREIKVSFFSTLVPNYVVLSYSIPSLKSWNLQRLSELSINFPPIVYAIIIIILTFIIPHLIQMHKQNQEKSLSKVLSNLLGGITVVVNDKSRRFHTVIHQNEHGDDKMSKDEIFTTITQPKEQIHSICTAIMT
ncbi:MAG TPA: hypothetical protein PLK68_13845, partial [Thomasclavelia ramosa]|nr:hypothetical protein [Thomasclavelia ramosa]